MPKKTTIINFNKLKIAKICETPCTILIYCYCVFLFVIKFFQKKTKTNHLAFCTSFSAIRSTTIFKIIRYRVVTNETWNKSNSLFLMNLRPIIYGGGLIFALRALRIRTRLYKHYEHLTSMLTLRRESKGKQHSWLSPYRCHNHLRAARVKGCRSDWARTAAPWLSHDWAARHTQSVQGSQSQTLRLIGCSLRTQPFTWLIDCTNAMK